MRSPRILLPVLLAATGARAAPAHTICISYFDDASGRPELAPLGKGLADMLITDLSGVESLRIVERARLNQALAELQLSRSRFIDPKNAVKLGKGLAAEYVMTGGYTVAGETMRIDVRVFQVESGRVVASTKVEGKRDDFFALEKELVDVLVDALALKLGRDEKARLRSNPTQSFEAWASYSAGLDAEDRGDAARARELFAKALAADPSYRAARTAMERLQATLAESDRQSEAQVDAAIKSLDPKGKDVAARVESILRNLDWSDDGQSRKKTAFLRSLAAQRLLACVKTAGASRDSPHVLHDGVPAGGVISHCRQAHEVLLIAHEFLDDPTVWDHVAKICEGFVRRLPGDRALASYCRETIAPGIQDAKANPDQQSVHQAPNMKAMLAAYAALD